MTKLSVVVCSHNPRLEFLDRTLVGLRQQDLELDAWELIVVDNSSEPALSSFVDLAWHPSATMIEERTLGLTSARLCGIAATSGELIVFVDDDNVLRNDYLRLAMGLFNSFPNLGAFGGQCLPEFVVSRPRSGRPQLGQCLH